VLENIKPFIDGAKTVEMLKKSSRDTAEYQLELMGSKGITGNPILAKVNELFKTPEVRGNDTVKTLLNKIVRSMKSMANEDGTFDAAVLYELRKSGLDDTINRFVGQNTSTSSNIINKVIPLKGAIDDAIDDAAGGGWKEYLETYTNLSRDIDQAKVANAIREGLTPPSRELGAQPGERSEIFAQMMRDQKGTIESATGFKGGPNKFSEMFPEESMAKLDGVSDSVVRREEAARLADKGFSYAREELGTDRTGRFPNALVRSVMITNAVLSRMGKKLQANTLNEVMDVMRDPKLAAQLLREASETENKPY